MFTSSDAFSLFSVDDIDKARRFSGETLGLDMREGIMGNLDVRLGIGARVFIDIKPDHVPAPFTVLNFVTDDVEKRVGMACFKDPDTNVLAVVAESM